MTPTLDADPLRPLRQDALEARIRFAIACQSETIGRDEYERLRQADSQAREAYIAAIERGRGQH